MEEAVRCVWKKADSMREGDSFSGNGTRILQAALWAQFWPHFFRLNNLSHMIKDLIIYPVWVPQEPWQHIQIWQQVVLSLGIVNICLVGSMLLPLMIWPITSGRFCYVSIFPGPLTNPEITQSLINSSVINPEFLQPHSLVQTST